MVFSVFWNSDDLGDSFLLINLYNLWEKKLCFWLCKELPGSSWHQVMIHSHSFLAVKYLGEEVWRGWYYQRYVWTVFISLEYITGNGIAKSCDNSVSLFEELPSCFPQWSHHFLHSHQQCRRVVFFFFFLLHCMACGILVPQPVIKLAPPTVKAQSLNHWTAREVPVEEFNFLSILVSTCYCQSFWL